MPRPRTGRRHRRVGRHHLQAGDESSRTCSAAPPAGGRPAAPRTSPGRPGRPRRPGRWRPRPTRSSPRAVAQLPERRKATWSPASASSPSSLASASPARPNRSAGPLCHARPARDRLHTAVAPACAGRPVGFDDHVADVPGVAGAAVVGRAVEHQAAADAGRDHHAEQSGRPGRRRAIARQAPCTVRRRRAAPGPHRAASPGRRSEASPCGHIDRADEPHGRSRAPPKQCRHRPLTDASASAMVTS